MVLPTCRGEVEGVGCGDRHGGGLSLWIDVVGGVVCGDRHLWWSFGDGTYQSLGRSVMGCMIVRWLDRRIGCEGEDWAHSKRSSSKAEAINEAKSKNKSKTSPPPIPVSYFPIGTQFSRL
ncbi:hypothetical protein SO802_007440 [Lithocarpus litseifolius]|uniref:Uncharacterized protein n=1 Tax=Lithocarpus litseifolius TaxID=425828 RepID=A0AAW2DR76_9ROSI